MSASGPTFSEFYATYLTHHRQPLNRALHLAAKLLALAALGAAAWQRSVLLLLAVPVLLVAPCWIGHLLFEGNRPVSWSQPAASLLGTIARLCRFAVTGQPRHDAGMGRLDQTGPPAVAERQAGGRAYYSFVADLRMCGEMLVSRSARSPSPPT